MNKLLFSSIAILSIGLVSCKKDCKIDRFTYELSTEEAQIILPSSGADISVNQQLIASTNNDYFVSGEMEYLINGTSQAKVNFGAGEENSTAELIQNGVTSSFEMKKDDSWCGDGKKSKYKKVIVEPIVKSEDCGYLIAGVIKYFDYDTGAWVATIDFGDRTCDDIAVKTTADGKYVTFKISEWYSKL